MAVSPNRLDPPKVAAIHDLAGFGKSSLTVVIPALAKEGIEVCPMPSAILSTQTDGFTDYTFCDLTKEMGLGIDHWIQMNLHFDALYTGFLGSEDQIEPVSRLIDYLQGSINSKVKNTLIVVDPVMGDNGELYGPYSKNFIEAIRRLIGRADLITPNLTEAAFLLGEDFPKGEISINMVEQWSRRLLNSLGGTRRERGVVITGIPVESKSRRSQIATVVATTDSLSINTEIKSSVFTTPRLDIDYPGTGDYFTSCLLASILKNNNLRGNSIKRGVKYSIKKTSRLIKKNIARKRIRRDGLAPEIL